MSDWQKNFIRSKLSLSFFRFISFAGVFSEFEVIKGLKNIVKEQVDMILSGTEQSTIITYYI